MPVNRKLKIRFAGRLIDLLGQQMYGGPVQSVAELIANAWDADAKKVEITIPENLNQNSEIIVKDFGKGMTFQELNDYYLHIGYERRKIRGERTEGNRLVMGRKGIGKLAGFGIAEDIVLKSVKDGKLVQFTLNYTTLRNLETVENHEFVPELDKSTNESDGVTVTFKKLKLTRSISLESFKKSMARRFALGSDKMEISINGFPITKENLDFDFRIPDTEGVWQTEDIEGFGIVKYWFGFLKDTIKDAELRGISVFARERVAQFTPFFFNLTGGINGQVGLEYLTGQLQAESLDEDDDFIATDRQTVNWQFQKAQILEQWGQQKVKDLCKKWKKRKDDKNTSKFRHDYGEFYLRIEHLQGQEKEDLLYALDKISTLERIEEPDFKVIANSMISGIERESVKKVIKRINATSIEALPELFEAIKEWDLLSAVMTAESIAGKINIIKKFQNLIDERTKEKAPGDEIDMQKFIKSYPWLLGPEYESFKPSDFFHERGVDSWIKDEIAFVDKEFKETIENRRFDLVIVNNPWRIIVLELMRPKENADIDHVNRLISYVTRIEDAVHSKGTFEEFQKISVYGLLIADKFAKSQSLRKFIQNNRNIIDAVEWGALFERVFSRYKDFFEILKNKAPDDPRLQGIVNFLSDGTTIN